MRCIAAARLLQRESGRQESKERRVRAGTAGPPLPSPLRTAAGRTRSPASRDLRDSAELELRLMPALEAPSSIGAPPPP
eukprot:scaffold57431_cov17-Tisochrysis_lutea.AAC.1